MGEIINFSLTPGNVDDRNAKAMNAITGGLFGKLIGDRGYISKKLADSLLEKNISLITKAKSNMKKKFMWQYDRYLLRKRDLIESVNDFIKNVCQIEHSRHRSPANFMVNLMSGLVAYSYLPKKPSLKFSHVNIKTV